jgi:alpha-tubulin suppressor-like RCC1 family protein
MKSHKFDMLGQIDALNKPVSFLSKTGFNSQFIIIDDILYSTSGNSGGNANYTTGRSSDNQNPFYGVDNFKRIPLPSSSPIVEAGGGYRSYAYALLEDGDLYTWGQNNVGQCGLGHTTTTPIPTLAAEDVTTVYSHPSNGCYSYNQNRLYIKKTDDYIYGTGYNGQGTLGLGDSNDRDEFTKITALGTTVESFWNMGATYGCAVAQKADKSIWVAGYNNYQSLGIVSTADVIEFTDVTSVWCTGGDTDLINVIGQFRYYTTAVTNGCSLGMLFDDGADTLLKMCGYNANCQLGDTTVTQRSVPITPNVGAGRIAKVAGMGGLFIGNCLKEDGNLYAWGRNGDGGVGDGTTTNRSTPAIVESDVEDIFSDGMDAHTYGYRTQSFIRKTDKQLYVCGYNGQIGCGLGHATSPITSHTRVLMPYNEEVVDIGYNNTSAAARVVLALTATNKLYVWGYNSQYGVTDASAVHCYVPVQVRLPKNKY